MQSIRLYVAGLYSDWKLGDALLDIRQPTTIGS